MNQPPEATFSGTDMEEADALASGAPSIPESETDGAEDLDPAADPGPEWKRRILEEFAEWLSGLEEEPPRSDANEGEGGDLLDLLTEFSVLRQEVRMQNREQRRAMDAISALSELLREKTASLDAAAGAMTRSREEAASVEASIQRMWREIGETRRETEKRLLLPFLDVRDALVRGMAATAPVSAAGLFGLFRKSVPASESLRQGYEMALRKFDRALAAAGVRPLDTVRKPFDPHVMRAVDTVECPEIPAGVVQEERLGGFVRGEELLRPAEVVVSIDRPRETKQPTD